MFFVKVRIEKAGIRLGNQVVFQREKCGDMRKLMKLTSMINCEFNFEINSKLFSYCLERYCTNNFKNEFMFIAFYLMYLQKGIVLKISATTWDDREW